ncbi:hypothetical protein [Chryseobacterium oryctis]|uniref:Intein N-terminal splicing region n=1 Tax=Chryseobacterium oryctis TaxID=2952618 RepID=A0ABT3HPZ6_9FLAO|nr:hypothetical protein [Chryseobacterium oryctis]MCW3161847.1 hypothetical protein [Chryseobacterium oryctis]
MKKVLFGFAIIISCSAFAQDIDFKKGNILVDDKECMKYESDALTVTFKDKGGEDLIILRYIKANGVDYNKVIFVNAKKELSASNFIFTKKLLFDRLMRAGVIKDCALHEDKIDNFILKYDEKVEERLNNTNTNTVIIQDSKPRNGVNISFGR